MSDETSWKRWVKTMQLCANRASVAFNLIPRGLARSHLTLALALLAITVLPGCAMLRGCFGPPPCPLPADLPLQDLVRHLNGNSVSLTSWRATNVEISSRGPIGLPVSLSAMLAVEAPRNFRLVANSPYGGNEVDLGSNAEQFWFWSKRSEEKYVFTARHDQMARALQRFPIPFEPDWVIEALGVIPIDEREVALEPGPAGSHRANLVSQRVSPQGEPVRKVTVVDTCHGLILEHGLFDASGRMIARAVLSGHYRHPTSAVVLPSRVDLEWPPAKLALTLKLGKIDVNPPLGAPHWTLPVIPNTPVMDLGR